MLKPLWGAAALLLVAQGAPADDAREVVRTAIVAVEGDSAAAVRARWDARLRADPGDRAAQLGLATLARLSYDYPDAAARYARLAAGTDRHAAWARLGLGEQLYTRGDLPAADAQLAGARAAARAVADPAAEAGALGYLAMARAPLVGLAVGLTLLDSADRVVPPGADDVRADLLRFRAVMLAVVAEPDSARRTAAACAAAARRAGLRRAEAQCLRAQALNLKLGGREDSSTRLLAEVARLQRAARDRSALAETLVRAADAVRATGRYGESRRLLREALGEATASRNEFALGAVRTALGAIALRLRDHAEADEQLRAAATVYETLGDSGSLAGVLAFQSVLDAAIGDLANARARARHAVAHYRRVGDVTEEFSVLRQLAAVELRAGDADAAAAALDEAAALARRHEHATWAWGLEVDRGRLALRRGDLAAAERHFSRYLAELDSSEHAQRHETRAHLAEIHARRGDLARAERELHAAGDELDTWRAGLSDDDLRLHVFQASGQDYDGRAPSTERVLAALAAGGRAEAALALAERSRARTLMDRLVQAEALRAGVGEAAARPADDVAPATRLRTAAAAGAADDGADAVRALRAAIPDARTAVVEYVAGREGAPSTVFVVTRAGVRARAMAPADSLAGVIARFAAMLEEGEAPAALARSLGAAVLDPVLDGLDATVTRLVIVADGPLHRVPFDALRLADGRWAVERFTIALAPSAGVAAALWQRPRAPASAPLRLLAMGDPAFGEGTGLVRGGTDVVRQATESAGTLPRLAASGDEAREVARFAPVADVRLREEASAAFLRAAPLADYRVIHLATHATVDDRGLGRSSIALAGEGGRSAFLGAGDLAALDLAADLVVLSACRTAGGVVLDGEGVQGLTAPLLEAGARAVVATAWPIGDRRTVGFVRDFYGAMATGLPVGDALREAKLAALRAGAPPGEWAAFTIVGDPMVTLALQAPTAAIRPEGWGVILGALFAAFLMGLVWLHRRKQRRDGRR